MDGKILDYNPGPAPSRCDKCKAKGNLTSKYGLEFVTRVTFVLDQWGHCKTGYGKRLLGLNY